MGKTPRIPEAEDLADAKALSQDTISVVRDAQTLATAAAEITGGSININIDSQSIQGERDSSFEGSEVRHFRRQVMSLTHKALLQKLIKPSGVAAHLTIGVRWQGNGCDVIGATPYLSSDSYVGYGTSVTGSIQALPSSTRAPQADVEGCERAACAEFSVSLFIDPMIGSTRVKSGHIIVCADGTAGAEWQ